jgi:hypothetical protein
MANPKIGQSATLNGKKVVWSGQNYGWQSPAQHTKLANDGKFKHGTQALDRVASSAKNFVKDKLPGVAKAATNYKNWSDESARRVAARDAKTTVGKGINAVKAVTNAPARAKDAAVQAVSNKTNLDPRIVRAGAEVVGAVVKTKAGQGITKASGGRVAPPTNRSVGAAAKADVAGRTAPATRRLPTPQKDGVVKPSTSRTQATKASSSPGIAQNVTKDQAAANASRTARSQPATPASQRGRTVQSGGTVRSNTGTTASQAGGPIKPKTDGTDIARGNNVVRSQASNRSQTQTNKRAAVSQSADRAIDHPGSTLPTNRVTGKAKPSGALDTQKSNPDKAGWTESTKATARKARDGGNNTSYMANGGRRDVAASENLAAKSRAAEKGASATRPARRSAVRAEITAAKEKVKASTKAFQTSNRTRDLTGSSRSSMETMSKDMGRRLGKTSSTATRRPVEEVRANPRIGNPNPPKATTTTTTGTRRVAANPPTSSNRGGKGKVVDGQTIRNTGSKPSGTNKYTERQAFNLTESQVRQGPRHAPAPRTKPGSKPSPTRTRGGNPAENFPQRPGRARMTGEFKNPAGGTPIKTESAGKFEPSGGLNVKSPHQPGRGSGIRPTDGRGSSTPIRREGSATKDTQRRNGQPVGRLGRSGEWNVDTPETRRVRADVKTANKAQQELDKINGKSAPKLPARSAAAKARLKQQQEALKATRAQRQSQPTTERGLKQLKRGYDQTLKNMEEVDRRSNPRYDGTTREPSRTHISGEVRIGGSKFGTDPKSAKMVDGSVTRTVGRTKKGGRSADASAQTSKTMEAVRKRRAAKARATASLNNPNTKVLPGKKKTLKNAKTANTIKAKVSQLSKGVRNAVDRKGNDLNYIMQQALKSLQQ